MKKTNIDAWFTALAAVPRDQRPEWLSRYGLRLLQIAADQQGAGDAEFLTKKQAIEYILENF